MVNFKLGEEMRSAMRNKNLPSLFFTLKTILTLLILHVEVRRMHVIHEPCIWPSLPWVLRCSVVRALTCVPKVRGSIPFKDWDFFLVQCSWHVDYIISQIIGCLIKETQVVNWLIVPLQRYKNIVHTVGQEFLSAYLPTVASFSNNIISVNSIAIPGQQDWEHCLP